MREARALNGGHLHFFLDRHGKAVDRTVSGEWVEKNVDHEALYNFSDLFGAKGMYAASGLLGDRSSLTEARLYCREVYRAIREDRFRSDQQPLDPKNPVEPVSGRKSHAPYMLALSLLSRLTEREGDSALAEGGCALTERVLNAHVNRDGKWEGLEPWDFVEFIDERGRPYRENGTVLSDPGHALEFIGLSLKFCKTVRGCCRPGENQLKTLAGIESAMFSLFHRNFTNGFNSRGGGIHKLIDLVSRKPYNGDMPWWSLPETMRAALEVYEISGSDREREYCLRAFALCHNAFTTHYVREDRNLMAIQTRSAEGRVINAIPATPDADPGYHTGLSLIDCLKIIREMVRDK